MSIVKGVLAFGFIVCNLAVWFLWLCVLAIAQLVFAPVRAAQPTFDRLMDSVIDGWAWCNRFMMSALRLTDMQLDWSDEARLSRANWYLVVSNHQSWVDIFMLQTRFVDRIPPLKFFTKKQLLWVPLLGVAMWLLGFPYVNRFTRAQIEADPSLRQRDQDNVREACKRVARHPACVLNFLEGTRFTERKREDRNSPYRHLLPPRVGGLGIVIDALSEQLECAVDVTLVYPEGPPSFWSFLCGRCPRVIMQVKSVDLPAVSSEMTDADRREVLMSWVDALWGAKDALIGEHSKRGS